MAPLSTAELPRLRRDDGPEAIIEAIEDAGAVIVEDLVADGQITALLDEVRPHVDDADPEMRHVNEALQSFFRGVRNVTGLAGKSATFVDAILLHPVLLAAADAIIGPNCASYTLNVGHLMVREPGAPRQWLHRDQNVWSFLPQPHPEVELASVIALDEFTEENGATVVAPGSHRWEPGRAPQEHELVPAEMPAGAGVVYLGSTIHAGGTNRSTRGRAGVHLSYVAGWLRPEENNTLATPPDVARDLPRRAQELIGYAMHDATAHGGGYLGCVDLRDPADLLATGHL
ncbi:MAG: phytanoyl-CoA dioxygenase family protein [Actinomycetota bacterium]|nr:phytanoyl-CoA dioxygenase family protein [Actinomycetota bacterium]